MYSFLPEQTAGVGTRNLHVCELQGILWPIIGCKSGANRVQIEM